MEHKVVLNVLLGGVAVLALAIPSAGVVQSLSCTIDAVQETPPNGSTAIGTGKFTIDTVANTLDFNITFSGLTSAETVSHLHGPAVPGMTTPPIFGLPAGSPKIGTWNYPQNMEANLLRGLIYVNIHSTMFPAGEIRGQVVKSKILRYSASLDSRQATPPNGSTATGSATMLIDTVANTLDFDITFSGLTSAETVAHIHGPAPPGMAAVFLFGLPSGSPKIGTWNYMESDEADILSGLMYINIHSAINTTGEIRGQILEDCGQGAVNLGGGGPQEVLTVNGSAGLPGCRVVTVPVNTDITVALASSGAGPANGSYVLYAWSCPPQNPLDLTLGPNALGCFGNPTPLHTGTPSTQPFRCLRGGLPGAVCAGVNEINAPGSTPFSLTKAGGLSNPTTVLLQAMLEDTGANALNFSVTNMVVLVVE